MLDLWSCVLAVLGLWSLDKSCFLEANLNMHLAREHASIFWSLVFRIDESDLLCLPIVHLVLIKTVLPSEFDFTDVGSGINGLSIVAFCHVEL